MREKKLLWKKVNRFCIALDQYPHEELNVNSVSWQKSVVMARWTSDFDCPQETQFWYCIKDNEFDIDSLKAKRRYEIVKGNRNFFVKLINPYDYKDELYRVYKTSFEGYNKGVKYKSEEQFWATLNVWTQKECCLFGCFKRETNELVGFSDVYIRGKYLPISSLKTCPGEEKAGVNFALVYAIVEHFKHDIEKGCYLCDGSRNVVHSTNFQDFLIKYFGFRRAYCKLNIEYKGVFKYVILAIFPLRKILKNINDNYVHLIYSLLRQEAWSRGKPE